jgi:hypothetical protein
MDQTLQESAGGQDHGGGPQRLAIPRDHANHAAIRQDQILGGAFADFEVRRGFQRGPHRLAIKFAVGLGARPAHCRTLAPVEDAELDSGGIGDAAHQPVGGIDLAHQMAFADTANGRVAGHLAQGRALVGEEEGLRPGARRRRRRFAAGMASADDDDVVAHGPLNRRGASPGQAPGDVSRETVTSQCKNP